MVNRETRRKQGKGKEARIGRWKRNRKNMIHCVKNGFVEQRDR